MESVFDTDNSLLEEAYTGKQELNANGARAKIHSCLALLIKLLSK